MLKTIKKYFLPLLLIILNVALILRTTGSLLMLALSENQSVFENIMSYAGLVILAVFLTLTILVISLKKFRTKMVKIFLFATFINIILCFSLVYLLGTYANYGGIKAIIDAFFKK